MKSLYRMMVCMAFVCIFLVGAVAGKSVVMLTMALIFGAIAAGFAIAAKKEFSKS